MNILISNSSLLRLCIYYSADHVCTELNKLNGIDFEWHYLAIEEALVKSKRTQSSSSEKKELLLKISSHLMKENAAVPVEKVIRKGRIKISLIP